jgi:hypothetical protein
MTIRALMVRGIQTFAAAAVALLIVGGANANVVSDNDSYTFGVLERDADQINKEILQTEKALPNASRATLICLERLRSDLIPIMDDSSELQALLEIAGSMTFQNDEDAALGVTRTVLESAAKDLATAQGLVNSHATECHTVAGVGAKAQQILSFMDRYGHAVNSLSGKLNPGYRSKMR